MLKKIKGEKYVQIGEKRGNRFFKSEMLSLEHNDFRDIIDEGIERTRNVTIPKITVWDIITKKHIEKISDFSAGVVGDIANGINDYLCYLIDQDKPGKKL